MLTTIFAHSTLVVFLNNESLPKSLLAIVSSWNNTTSMSTVPVEYTDLHTNNPTCLCWSFLHHLPPRWGKQLWFDFCILLFSQIAWRVCHTQCMLFYLMTSTNHYFHAKFKKKPPVGRASFNQCWISDTSPIFVVRLKRTFKVTTD